MAKAKAKSSDVIINNEFLKFIIILIMIACTIVCAFGCYYKFFVPEPQTLVTAYFKELTYAPEGEEEDVYMFDWNIYTNKEKTPDGIPVFEMKVASYTDYSKTTFQFKGMQTKGPFMPLVHEPSRPSWWYTNHESIAPKDTHLLAKVEYYKQQGYDLNEYFGIEDYDTWFTEHKSKVLYETTNANDVTEYYQIMKEDTTLTPVKFKEKECIYWDINGQFMKLEFKGRTKIREETHALGWKDYYYATYDPMYFYTVMYNSIMAKGVGTHIFYLDLAEYFNLYKWDENLLRFGDNPINGVDTKAIVKMRATVYDRGLLKSSESLFDYVGDDPKYNNTEETPQLFWQARINKTLTAKDFDTRFSEAYNGNFLTLKDDTFNYLKEQQKINVHLKLNADEVIGLDYSALKDLKIETITIEGTTNKTFKFLAGALKNCGVKTIKHSSNVTIEVADEISFEEVIL